PSGSRGTGGRSASASTPRCRKVCCISSGSRPSCARRPPSPRCAGSRRRRADVPGLAVFGARRVAAFPAHRWAALALEVRRRCRRAEEGALVHGPAAERRAADVADREAVERLGAEVDGAVEAGRLVALVAGAHDVADVVPGDRRAHPLPALAQVGLDLVERPVREAAARIEPVTERAVHLVAVELAFRDPASLEVRIRHVLEAGRLPPPCRVPLVPHDPLPLSPVAPCAPAPAWKRCKRRAAGGGSVPGGGAGSVIAAT